jgi:hypothetical protein
MDQLRDALLCGRSGCKCPTGKNVHCPAHDDSDPSLTYENTNGKILFNCKKGCSQQAVIAAMTANGWWPPEKINGKSSPAPRVAAQKSAPRKESKLTQEWAFTDAAGTDIAYHGRFDYVDDDGKEFRWRLPDGEYKDGLRGQAAMADLPLYNLEGVLEDDSETVYVVEGEKAADACIEHGLVAVALGGGAGQTQFGESLDPLFKRDVVLWPDNDDAGRALMAKVHSILPHAKMLKPEGLPDKGDAYDYFEVKGKGRTAALRKLVQDPSAAAHFDDLDLVLDIPAEGGFVRIVLSDIHSGQNVLNANWKITPGNDIAKIERRTSFNGRLNAFSVSQRTIIRRELDNYYGKEPVAWSVVLNDACDIAIETYTNASRAIDMSEISPDYEVDYRVDKMLPEGEMSILFAMGDSGKTYLSLDILLALLYKGVWLGRPTLLAGSAMFIDYESSEKVIRKRFQRLLDAHGIAAPDAKTFHYYPARGIPISTQIESIRRDLKRLGIDYIVVDSAAAACGGKPEDADMALATFNALQSLGVTVLLIAHNTKGDDEFYPFGSIFWHNSARATWFVKKVQVPGEDDIHLALHNRKMNDDAKQKSFGVKIHFDGKNGPVTVTAEAIQDQQHGSTAQAEVVADVLAVQSEAISVADLLTALEVSGIELSAASVRKILNKGRTEGTITRTGSKNRALWATNEA